MAEIALTGLRGDSPIGAMAAFGLLRLNPTWRLSWTNLRAVVTTGEEQTPDAILTRQIDIAKSHKGERPEFEWAEKGILREADPERWCKAVSSALDRYADRELGWLSSFGAPLKKEFGRTPFDCTSGSQSFLNELANLPKNVTLSSMQEALFGPWLYSDSTHSLGWDPAMMHSGAFTSEQPRSNKRKRGVTAVVWLASESLPLFPCFVNDRGKLVTRGWIEGEFRWPLWNRPISYRALISLLSNSEGRQDIAIYGSARSKVGRQPGFSEARLICED